MAPGGLKWDNGSALYALSNEAKRLTKSTYNIGS